MTATSDWENSCLQQVLGIKLETGKWHFFVILAMVEKSGNTFHFISKILMQFKTPFLIFIIISEGRRDKKNRTDLFFDLIFSTVFHQHSSRKYFGKSFFLQSKG